MVGEGKLRHRVCAKCVVLSALGLSITQPCLAAPTAGGQSANTSGSPLSVVGPAEAVLGDNTSVSLRIDSSQTPTEQLDPAARLSVAHLQWHTNTGTITVSADGSSLEYRPPTTKYPQVALIAAYDAPHRTVLSHSISLQGAPTIEVKSEPRVDVRVEVAGRSYGPVRTDREGLAQIKVVVPPGSKTVTTFATDGFGNVTQGEVALDASPFSRTLILCSAQEQSAYVLSVDQTGTPATKPLFSVTANGVDVSAIELVRPGLFRVSLHPSEVPDAGLTVAAVARTGTERVQCEFEVPPPPKPDAFGLKGVVNPIERPLTFLVGGQAGAYSNWARVSGPWLGVRLAYAVSGTREGLRVELEGAFSHSSGDVSTTGAATAESLALSVRSLPLFASARYSLALDRWHASAALSLGTSLTSVTTSGQTISTTETATPLFYGAALGAGMWLGGDEVGLELGYADASINTGEVSGNVAGLRAVVGYYFALQ